MRKPANMKMLSAEADPKSVLGGLSLEVPLGPERSVAMTLDHRAHQAREQLFERYDQLNALWQKAEEQFRKNHIPRPVVYEFPRDPDLTVADELHEYLSLQKIKGEWHICHGGLLEYSPEDLDWKPITECSAELRVEMVKHLPGLRQAAVESAEQFVPAVDAAIVQMSDLTK